MEMHALEFNIVAASAHFIRVSWKNFNFTMYPTYIQLQLNLNVKTISSNQFNTRATFASDDTNSCEF